MDGAMCKLKFNFVEEIDEGWYTLKEVLLV